MVGRTYQVEVVAQGPQLEVWIDGVQIFAVTDTSFASGTIALYTWANEAGSFDDVVVEELSTGTVLLADDFNDGEFTGWTVLDEGTKAAPSALYQFTDKDSVTLQREFTRQVAPGALASLNLKLVSTVPGATPPASCAADGFAYDPNGASDAASIPPADLGYVGGLDSSNYGGGTTFTNLNLLSDVRFITIWSAATGTLVQSSNIFSSPTDASDLAKLGTFSLYTAGGE